MSSKRSPDSFDPKTLKSNRNSLNFISVDLRFEIRTKNLKKNDAFSTSDLSALEAGEKVNYGSSYGCQLRN